MLKRERERWRHLETGERHTHHALHTTPGSFSRRESIQSSVPLATRRPVPQAVRVKLHPNTRAFTDVPRAKA